MAVAPQASAHIFWTSQATDTIGRASLDGANPIRKFIPTAAVPPGVAIDGSHVYWAQGSAQGSIGRARLNGSVSDQSFIKTGIKEEEDILLKARAVRDERSRIASSPWRRRPELGPRTLH